MGLLRELIYITLGKQEKFSRELGEDDWERLYNEAKKQSLLGALLPGVEKTKPAGRLPRPLMRWWGKVSKLEERNKLVSQRAAELTKIFEEGGFRSCVLKGQSVALYYPNPLRRQCGDIDLWVWPKEVRGERLEVRDSARLEVRDEGLVVSRDARLEVRGDERLGGRDRVLEFVRRTARKTDKVFIHHIDAKYFDDVTVEIHVWPSYSYSPFRYRKYKKFFREYRLEVSRDARLGVSRDARLGVRGERLEVRDEGLEVRGERLEVRGERLEKVGFYRPSLRFDSVYLLLHIFRHIYHEGIGLRQLMDYYYCLEKLSDEERRWALEKLKWMELERFCAAIMYVEKVAFGLDDDKMLCSPNEKYGKFLLKEIVRVGNFGKYDATARNLHKKEGETKSENASRIVRLYLHNVGRLFDLIGICPSEVLWSPVWKPVHFVWRMVKGY